uniref:Uncharacterized protein n=1 Tax=Anopheles atroparvus TaxID=41427 RepID=A0AAG5DTU6_ANOAO
RFGDSEEASSIHREKKHSSFSPFLTKKSTKRRGRRTHATNENVRTPSRPQSCQALKLCCTEPEATGS